MNRLRVVVRLLRMGHRSRLVPRFTVLLAALLSVVSLPACGGGGDGPATPVTPPAGVAPTASFTRTPTAGVPGDSVQFTDTSAPGSAPITAWLWDFGDGGSSTQQNPAHVYSIAGAYQPSLRVTTSVGSDLSDPGFGAVAITAPLPPRIIDTLNGAANTPPLPEPAVFGDVLPTYSEERLLNERPVREFRPVVVQARLTTWQGTLGVNDCSVGAGLAQIPEPAATPPVWVSTRIPQRNTTHLFSWRYATAYNDLAWPGAFPARLALVAVYNAPGQPEHGQSYKLGSEPRWESCEEMTPFLQDWYTAYHISYNQQIADWPVMRHYQVWKKIGEDFIPSQQDTTYSLEWMTGVSQTTAWEFTVSVTATVGAKGPTTHGELSATVSATMSESVTFSSEERLTKGFGSKASIRPEYNLAYSVWVLVDRYRVERSAAGPRPNPWTDPDYILGANTFEFEVQSRTVHAQQSAWFLR